MSEEDYDRRRLPNGWVDVNRDEQGIWRITWAPDEGHPDWPGRTYSPADADLPGDYPGPDDKEALLDWGEKRWKDV